MMHRRTDLWGPDGTPTPRVFDGILTYVVFQRRNSTPTASSMLASRSTSLRTRSSSYRSTPARVSASGSRYGSGRPSSTARALITSTPQFAYNEMSFMIIRMLQAFTSVKLDLASAPPEAQPPAEWAQATGRKAIEKVFPKMHLTMYANVRLHLKIILL